MGVMFFLQKHTMSDAPDISVDFVLYMVVTQTVNKRCKRCDTLIKQFYDPCTAEIQMCVDVLPHEN